jgi:hypothetical protein
MDQTHPRRRVYQTPLLPAARAVLGRLARLLGDSRYVVATAAIEAFAGLTPAAQAKAVARVRERLAADTATAGG